MGASSIGYDFHHHQPPIHRVSGIFVFSAEKHGQRLRRGRTRVDPVIQADAGENKNTAAFAISTDIHFSSVTDL